MCGNCGEVAFQCRKCRHINYDRLDAFLCVECGYCASGSFSFELTAGVATNAVAITNDQDYERALTVFGATTSLHEELRDALREKVRSVSSKKKSSGKQDDSDGLFSPAMKRAFLGLPPLHDHGKDSIVDILEKPGSVVKFVARPDSSQLGGRTSTAADRTRSLLRLARQMRSDSASPDRRRSSDVIIRHLGRGLAIDEEDDVMGLLEGNSVLDSSEPLSRVIANVQSRRRTDGSRTNAQAGQRAEGAPATSSKKSDTGKEILDECQKLHLLVREAERETYELDRRIKAWKRLEGGSLLEDETTREDSIEFTPSHCSVCSSAVALQLLFLWLISVRNSCVYCWKISLVSAKVSPIASAKLWEKLQQSRRRALYLCWRSYENV